MPHHKTILARHGRPHEPTDRRTDDRWIDRLGDDVYAPMRTADRDAISSSSSENEKPSLSPPPLLPFHFLLRRGRTAASEAVVRPSVRQAASLLRRLSCARGPASRRWETPAKERESEEGVLCMALKGGREHSGTSTIRSPAGAALILDILLSNPSKILELHRGKENVKSSNKLSLDI